jgi:hypothetical protein
VTWLTRESAGVPPSSGGLGCVTERGLGPRCPTGSLGLVASRLRPLVPFSTMLAGPPTLGRGREEGSSEPFRLGVSSPWPSDQSGQFLARRVMGIAWMS